MEHDHPRGECRGLGMRFRHRYEDIQGVGRRGGVVVQEEGIVCARLQSGTQSDIVPLRPTEITVAFDDRNPFVMGISFARKRHRTIRAGVINENKPSVGIAALQQRIEARPQVLHSVPVDNQHVYQWLIHT